MIFLVTKKMDLFKKIARTNPLEIILAGGFLLRIIIFLFLSPFNPDDHYEVVRYVHDYHAIPLAMQLGLSFHPPLYYFIASFFVTNNAKTVQMVSLFFSIGNITAIYWLVKNTLDASLKIKKICLLGACLLTPFVLFSNHISSDGLSFLIGSLVFIQIFQCLKKLTFTRLFFLGIFLGLGLLSKGTLIAFIPPLVLFVILVCMHNKLKRNKITLYLLLFSLIFSVIGSYKFVQNYCHYGKVIIHGMDRNPEWADGQRPTYRSLREFFNFNVFKLVSQPTVSENTRYSLPLIFYGTLWSQYITENSYYGHASKFEYLDSIIYMFAMVPSMLFFVGFFRILARDSKDGLCLLGSERSVPKKTYTSICVLILLTNFCLVVAAGLKYDIWSAYQSRLLFPSFFPMLLIFSEGLNWVKEKHLNFEKWTYFSLNVLVLLFGIYFFIKIISVPLIPVVEQHVMLKEFAKFFLGRGPYE